MGTLPPHQRPSKKFPVLHIRKVPDLDAKTWDFLVKGHIENPIRLTYGEFLALDKTTTVGDFHCVQGWSKLDLTWGGVRFIDIANLAQPKNNARFVTIAADDGYTTSLQLNDLMSPEVLFAYELDNKPLEQIHGGPLRLVVPKKYAYKSAKWVRKVVFTEELELGYWEQRGYSNSADPWKEERYAD